MSIFRLSDSSSGQTETMRNGATGGLVDADFIKGVFSLIFARGVSDSDIEKKLSQSRLEIIKRAIGSTEFVERTIGRFLAPDLSQNKLDPIVDSAFVDDVVECLVGHTAPPIYSGGGFSGWASAFQYFLMRAYAAQPDLLLSLGKGADKYKGLVETGRLLTEIEALAAENRPSRALAVAISGIGDGVTPLAPIAPVLAALLGASRAGISALIRQYSTQMPPGTVRALRGATTSALRHGLLDSFGASIELNQLLPPTFAGLFERKAAKLSVTSPEGADDYVQLVLSSEISQGEANLPNDDLKMTVVAPDPCYAKVEGSSSAGCKIEIVPSLAGADFAAMDECPVLLSRDNLNIDADTVDKVIMSLSYGRPLVLIGASEATVGTDAKGGKILFTQPDPEPIAIILNNPQEALGCISGANGDLVKGSDELISSGALRVYLPSKEFSGDAATADTAEASIPFALVDLRATKLPISDNEKASLADGSLIAMRAEKFDFEPEITGQRLAEELQMALGENTSLPLVVLSDDFEYSPDYSNQMILRAIRSQPNTVNCARGLEIGRKSNQLELSSVTEINTHYAAFLACSSMSAEAAIRIMKNWGESPARDAVITSPYDIQEWGAKSYLVSKVNPDLLARQNGNVRLLQTIHASRISRGSILAPTAQQTTIPSFFGRSMARKRTNLLRQLSECVLKGEALSETEPNLLLREDLRPLFVGLIETGHKQSVSKFLNAVAADLAVMRSLTTDELREMLNLAQICGQHKEIAAKLLPVSRLIMGFNQDRVMPLFSFLAGASDEQDFTSAVMMTFADSVMSDDRDRINIRLLDVVTRFCSSLTAMAATQLLDEKQPDLLRLDSVQRLLARHLGHLEATEFDLPISQVNFQTVQQSLNPPDRLVDAILRANREDSVHLLRLMGDAGHPTASLVDTVRPYSYELASLKITSQDWPYHLSYSAENALRVAIVLGDTVMVNTLSPQVDDLVLSTAAGAVQPDKGVLDATYAACAARLGVRPMTFKGDTINALFEHLLQQSETFEREQVQSQPARPLISVIMTVFEPDIELLKMSLKSVLNQTIQNFEIFLIDDSSSPAFRAQVTKASKMDPRIFFLDTGKNVGPYLGRNLALKWVRGDYIAIQDGDDFSHPQRFERQLAAFQEYPDIAGVASAHYRFDSNGRIQFEHGLTLAGDGTMSSMFHRSTFVKLGGFARVRSRGDVEFRERIRSALGPGAFVQLADPLIFCNSSPSTLSHTVNRTKREHLQEFRSNFSRMAWDYSKTPVRPAGQVAVPFGLRP